MRQYKISPFTASLPHLGVLTNVMELTHYDMIYIYHHIQQNTLLELRRDEQHVYDKNAVEVWFKGFKLGYVSNKVNGLIARKIDAGKEVMAKVRNVKKQKYTPLSGLDIELFVQ